MLYFEVMLRRVILFIFLAVVPLTLFFSYSYFSDVHGELFDPLIGVVAEGSAGAVASNDVVSDVPVACILEHGTFQLTQQDCDEMLMYQINQNLNVSPISCEIPAGTFLISSRECEILRTAKGSSDVTRRIDE